MAAVNRLKAKLIKLYCARLAREVEMQTPERVQKQRISLYRLIKRRTRREQIITEIQDPNNRTQTSIKEMLDAFSVCMRQKYGPILVEDECVRQMAEAGHRRLSEEWKETLDMSLTLERLKRAVKKGGGNKAPGRDGIGLEFSKVAWGVLNGDMLELFTQMFEGNKLSEQQKRGVILCNVLGKVVVKPAYNMGIGRHKGHVV
jgi:hypothetical protein